MTGPTTHPSILLADSDAQSREVFGSFFKRAGWLFDIVTDTTGVVGALDGREYDIIIADVAMPGADGLALLAQILKKKPSQAIIAVSKDGSFDEALKFFRSGATDLLARPVDFGWLERVVKQVVNDRRQGERERLLYRFVTNERTELHFTCRELAELDTISLPIINRLLAGGLIDQGAALRMKLAVQEAVVNALEHGNLELKSEWKEEIDEEGRDRFFAIRKERLADPQYADRTIKIGSWFDGARFEVTIADQGKGFLNGSFGQKRAQPSGGPMCSGRGLAMMSNAVDEVRFGANGSEVTLVKLMRRPGS